MLVYLKTHQLWPWCDLTDPFSFSRAHLPKSFILVLKVQSAFQHLREEKDV